MREKRAIIHQLKNRLKEAITKRASQADIQRLARQIENIKYFCLVMSEKYIKNHFADIKNYANAIENRVDDEGCTMQNILADNAEVLSLVQKHNVNYILIDNQYEIDIDL